jgi:hypothetical protein
MTIPYLMNCPHSDDSWCLECVKELGEKSERDTALLRQALEALREARAVDCGCPWLDHWNDAITALRERLGEKA